MVRKDQQEETYIESVFFVNREDAESYIKDVLIGKESFRSCCRNWIF